MQDHTIANIAALKAARDSLAIDERKPFNAALLRLLCSRLSTDEFLKYLAEAKAIVMND